MAERNRLINGRFLHNLNGWTISGAAYSAGDGDEHYGVAVLADTEYIQQAFAVLDTRLHTLHVSAYAASGFASTEVQIIITDGDGNTVATKNIAITAATWTENSYTLGLAPGTTYNIKIINNSAGEDIKIDDVWLWYVPLTRAEIASRVNTNLGRLSTDRSLSTVASGAQTEGDFTYAIDAGLRSLGAINPETGTPDVRYIDPQDVNGTLDAVLTEMLQFLQRDYATEVDLSVGPRRESLSQIGKSIGEMLPGSGGGQSGGGQIVMRKLNRG